MPRLGPLFGPLLGPRLGPLFGPLLGFAMIGSPHPWFRTTREQCFFTVIAFSF